MNHITIELVYEGHGSTRPVTIARVHDPELVFRTAQTAIAEAESRAATLAEADLLLGEVQKEEVQRLKRVFELLMGKHVAGDL